MTGEKKSKGSIDDALVTYASEVKTQFGLKGKASPEDQLKSPIGDFGPVRPEVWTYEVSGLKVVYSWLNYRMRRRGGKKSSPLDDIRPASWTPAMTDEFLELLWVLEATLAMEPDLAKSLDSTVAGPCFRESELPKPSTKERQPPGRTEVGAQSDLFDGDSDNAEEDGEDES